MNKNKNTIARISTAVAIAATFFMGACGTETAPPAQDVSFERPEPAKQAHTGISADSAERQAMETIRRHYEDTHTVPQPDRMHMHGNRNPDYLP